MRNYCVEALKAEQKDVLHSMIFNCTIILGMQIFFSTFFIAALTEGDKLVKSVFMYSIMLIVTISLQTYFIRDCILKRRNVENTKLVKLIRSQLPTHSCNREIDYIFNILNIDLESTNKNIGHYYFGNEWLMSIPHKMVCIMAIKYTNIQKFEWASIGTNSENSVKGLIITCLYPEEPFKVDGIHSHDLYLYFKEMMPEKEYTRAAFVKDFSKAYHSFKDSRKGNDKK